MSELSRRKIKPILPELTAKVNRVLLGEGLGTIAPILRRIDSTGELPYWFVNLRKGTGLPNLDGKTVGSVVEKITVAVMEAYFLDGMRLSVNPAKGVDVPELELGIKSPSTNWCTSEPFFSPYERLLGNENDAIVLLTNYQEAKGKNKVSRFKLQILKSEYLMGSEIADKKLCDIARRFRDLYREEPAKLMRVFRFVSYVNQQDWAAKHLIRLMQGELDDASIDTAVAKIKSKFIADNAKATKNSKPPLDPRILRQVTSVLDVTPHVSGLIEAIDSWVRISSNGTARDPNENEMKRLVSGLLNGRISMSFALQWRYNFEGVFPDVKSGKAKRR